MKLIASYPIMNPHFNKVRLFSNFYHFLSNSRKTR